MGKPAILGAAMMALIGLGACSSASDPAARPSQVTATPAGGAPGKGPLVVSSPALHQRGKKGSQKVVLSDRVLVITNVTARPAANHGSILIDLHVVVRNTSAKPIRNQSTFFELMGPEGDAFSPQSTRLDPFYRPVTAHMARRGVVTFEIPAAAESGLYLLYRSEIATETVLIRLPSG